MVVGNKKNVAHPTWLSPRREREKVHDAIAYAPYNLRVINQTYAAYELQFTIYQSDICGLRVWVGIELVFFEVEIFDIGFSLN